MCPASPPAPPSECERRALRQRLRAQRLALPASTRVAAAQALLAQVEQIPEFLTDRRIAGYWATAGELPLAALLGGIHARGQTWYLPVVQPGRLLRFAPWHMGAALAPNRYGIPEPACTTADLLAASELDVVLLPLLGFDRRGHRLGFGGGYYDRSLAFLRGRREPARPLLVGIAYALQEVPRLEAQAWDVRLDYVATERELIHCMADG